MLGFLGYVLLFAAIVAGAFGILIFAAAKSVLHEIEGALVFVVAAVLGVGGLVSIGINLLLETIRSGNEANRMTARPADEHKAISPARQCGRCGTKGGLMVRAQHGTYFCEACAAKIRMPQKTT